MIYLLEDVLPHSYGTNQSGQTTASVRHICPILMHLLIYTLTLVIPPVR